MMAVEVDGVITEDSDRRTDPGFPIEHPPGEVRDSDEVASGFGIRLQVIECRERLFDLVVSDFVKASAHVRDLLQQSVDRLGVAAEGGGEEFAGLGIGRDKFDDSCVERDESVRVLRVGS